jgi:hypothetical protein
MTNIFQTKQHDSWSEQQDKTTASFDLVFGLYAVVIPFFNDGGI